MHRCQVKTKNVMRINQFGSCCTGDEISGDSIRCDLYDDWYHKVFSWYWFPFSSQMTENKVSCIFFSCQFWFGKMDFT